MSDMVGGGKSERVQDATRSQRRVEGPVFGDKRPRWYRRSQSASRCVAIIFNIELDTAHDADALPASFPVFTFVDLRCVR